MLHDIWQAETQKSADHALDRFMATYEAKYPKAATASLRLTGSILRTTNPSDSTFANIRLRTGRQETRGFQGKTDVSLTFIAREIK